MRTTLCMNMKGGTGKTSTVINMAAILYRYYQQHVLLVDADSQGNLSEFLVDAPEQLYDADGTADLLKGKKVRGLLATKIAGAQLLPGDGRLMTLDIAAMQGGSLSATAMRDWLQGFRNFQTCLIDCPPAFSAAAMAACRAADDVIIPVKLDDFGIRGVAKIVEQIHNMQELNPKLKIAGVLPTMTYKSETQEEAEDQLKAAMRSLNVKVFPHIRRSSKVDESTFAQLPLTSYSPKSAACQDYKRFVEAYLDGEV